MLSAATSANRMTTYSSRHNQGPSQDEEYAEIPAALQGKPAGMIRPTPQQNLSLANGYSYQFDHSELPVERAQAEGYNSSQSSQKLTIISGHQYCPQKMSLQSLTPAPGTAPALERTAALAEGYSDMYYGDGTGRIL